MRAISAACSRRHRLRPRWRERLGEITVPTLVVHGDEDPFFPHGNGVALAAEIPGATLLTLPGIGQGVPRADVGQDVADALLRHTCATPAANLNGGTPGGVMPQADLEQETAGRPKARYGSASGKESNRRSRWADLAVAAPGRDQPEASNSRVVSPSRSGSGACVPCQPSGSSEMRARRASRVMSSLSGRAPSRWARAAARRGRKAAPSR